MAHDETTPFDQFRWWLLQKSPWLVCVPLAIVCVVWWAGFIVWLWQTL